MELAVDGRTVLLATHKTYCEGEELQTLRAISQYHPLLSYLQSCAERGALPTAIVVRRLYRIAHRIHGAEVDVVYEDATRHSTTAYVVQLSNLHPALLMPVVAVNGKRYALLAQESTLSQGLRPVVTCIRGCVDDAGRFDATAHAAALSALGVSYADAKPLSSQKFTIGNEGEPPLRVYSMTLHWDAGSARAVEASNGLVLMPLEEVPRAGDVGAAFCASMLPQQ
jgi:hypothetical protein